VTATRMNQPFRLGPATILPSCVGPRAAGHNH
jgi:hypothetical protein